MATREQEQGESATSNADVNRGSARRWPHKRREQDRPRSPRGFVPTFHTNHAVAIAMKQVEQGLTTPPSVAMAMPSSRTRSDGENQASGRAWWCQCGPRRASDGTCSAPASRRGRPVARRRRCKRAGDPNIQELADVSVRALEDDDLVQQPVRPSSRSRFCGLHEDAGRPGRCLVFRAPISLTSVRVGGPSSSRSPVDLEGGAPREHFKMNACRIPPASTQSLLDRPRFSLPEPRSGRAEAACKFEDPRRAVPRCMA